MSPAAIRPLLDLSFTATVLVPLYGLIALAIAYLGCRDWYRSRHAVSPARETLLDRAMFCVKLSTLTVLAAGLCVVLEAWLVARRATHIATIIENPASYAQAKVVGSDTGWSLVLPGVTTRLSPQHGLSPRVVMAGQEATVSRAEVFRLAALRPTLGVRP